MIRWVFVPCIDGLLTWTDRLNDRFGFGNLDMEL